MTLLINELISLLEKDNKSNNDNSKLIPANNNQDKLYNNLISLLSKNIEDFITATEKKEDILLRGLNDLKTKREEQDTIFASGAQYSSDETNDTDKEESDEPDKSNVKPEGSINSISNLLISTGCLNTYDLLRKLAPLSNTCSVFCSLIITFANKFFLPGVFIASDT